MARIAITGATGNVGWALVRRLAADPEMDAVVGIARRVPTDPGAAPVRWVGADVRDPGLAAHFRGADAVIHLAWLIQPSRHERTVWAANVEGTAAVLDAVATADVPAVVVASSVGAYSPGPKDRPVDEAWPTHGVGSSSYSRQKAYVERLLDAFELAHPGTRVVRLRPGLVFQGPAGPEIRRYFGGPFVPPWLVSPRRLPVVPRIEGLVFQAVHADDLADAYRLAAARPVRGAFNVAADPVLDPPQLARALGARLVPVPRTLARVGADVTWKLRLQPTEAGWVDLALAAPVMDITRARRELGWQPTRSATQALTDLLEGMAAGEGAPTPPLAADTPRRRLAELRTGVGGADRPEA